MLNFSELQRRSVLRVAAAYLVVGWLLTEVLTTILPTLGAPDWASKAVILSFVFGFIPAVVLSWIYELTPSGLRKEKDGSGDEVGGTVPVGRLEYLTIGCVILATIFLAISFSVKQSPNESNTGVAAVSAESIAVLPFVNMSNDKDNDYFSDGLTETLLHMLAQIPDLKVAARTSSFAFKGKNMDIRQIAEALQVAHVLEGSVQQSGSRVRITAQLIRASDGYHVWSESFDVDDDDIFAIQDKIAKTIGFELSATLLGTDDNPMIAGVATEDPDAYDLYLQALKHRATFSYTGLAAAEDLLKGALLIDPDFLDAKTELANNYLHQSETGMMSRDVALASVIAITDQVLLESPKDIGARAIHVFAQASQNATSGDSSSLASAIDELEVLVASHPREYLPRRLLSRMLKGVQRSEAALQLQKESLSFDPYNARIHFEIGSLYLSLDRLEEARAALLASLEIEPNQPNAFLELSQIALNSGNGVDYLQQSLKAMALDPRDHEIPGFIAAFLYQLGLVEEADDFRKRVLAIAPASAVAYRIELLRAISLDDEAAGLTAARRTIEGGIDDRQFAFGGAVQYLLRTAASHGTIDVESAYLEQHWPGILDVDAPVITIRYLTAQRIAFDAWSTTLPREELLRRVARVEAIAASYGVDLRQDHDARMAIMALQGGVEGAIELALSDVIIPSVLTNLDWRRRFAQAQYVEMMADPRIQVALQAWETEEAEVRDKVRDFLFDLSSTP